MVVGTWERVWSRPAQAKAICTAGRRRQGVARPKRPSDEDNMHIGRGAPTLPHYCSGVQVLVTMTVMHMMVRCTFLRLPGYHATRDRTGR